MLLMWKKIHVNAIHLKKKDKFKCKKDKRKKKAHVAYDDNEIILSSDEDCESKALMASHHSSDE